MSLQDTFHLNNNSNHSILTIKFNKIYLNSIKENLNSQNFMDNILHLKLLHTNEYDGILFKIESDNIVINFNHQKISENLLIKIIETLLNTKEKDLLLIIKIIILVYYYILEY